ncbi:hypothetical protein [Bacillus sp. Marseille-P3661]|uniref:hypothetical protein n=1 Tax=Bacillus sp. Marseille-P3661 TaxID=1936234 RepID=UPI000C85171A|nr:hypothetical protein [Bacillus sp. Marseille-P3661]
MPMEQEVYPMLVWGFSFFMVVSLITVITLRIRNKSYKSAYNLIIAHFVIFSFAGIALLNAMKVNSNTHQSMASEVASMRLGSAGILWAISMMCLLAGLTKFNSGSEGQRIMVNKSRDIFI